jgi:hypothetical protein
MTKTTRTSAAETVKAIENHMRSKAFVMWDGSIGKVGYEVFSHEDRVFVRFVGYGIPTEVQPAVRSLRQAGFDIDGNGFMQCDAE